MVEKQTFKPPDKKTQVKKDQKDPEVKKDKKDPDGKLLFYLVVALALVYIYLMLFGIFSQKHTIFIYPD